MAKLPTEFVEVLRTVRKHAEAAGDLEGPVDVNLLGLRRDEQVNERDAVLTFLGSMGYVWNTFGYVRLTQKGVVATK